MKKLILITAFIAISTVASAQFSIYLIEGTLFIKNCPNKLVINQLIIIDSKDSIYTDSFGRFIFPVKVAKVNDLHTISYLIRNIGKDFKTKRHFHLKKKKYFHLKINNEEIRVKNTIHKKKYWRYNVRYVDLTVEYCKNMIIRDMRRNRIYVCD